MIFVINKILKKFKGNWENLYEIKEIKKICMKFLWKGIYKYKVCIKMFVS